MQQRTDSWPYVIHLTYKTKEEIPFSIVRNLKNLNPGFEVRLYGDKECIEFLEEHFTQEHVELFKFIKDGPIKADFFRVCVLYILGGVYLDVDTQLQQPLLEFIPSGVDFVTSGCDGNVEHLNPIIIVSKRRSTILEACIARLLENRSKEYSYWGYSICPALYQVVNEQIDGQSLLNVDAFYKTRSGDNVQLLNETWGRPDILKSRINWNGKVVLLNHNPSLYTNDSHSFIDGAHLPHIWIGSSDTNVKTVQLDQCYDPDTMLMFCHDYPDTFDYVFKGNELTIRRTDLNSGWGQKLVGYL